MKPVLLYLALVGLPVLGIWGLLQVGRNLSAPVCLSGKWSAELDPLDKYYSLQDHTLLRRGPTILSITQSGPNLLLSFDDNQQTTLVGSVQGTTINAAVLRQGAIVGTFESTSSTNAIYFYGRIDRQSEPDRLFGSLIFAHGPSRTEVPLTAMRQSEGAEFNGGH